MGNIYFVADVHLNGSMEKEEIFIGFLEMVSRKKGDLYILGDLFDYWANNRKVINDNIRVLKSFKKVSENGAGMFFLRGNRDFLVSPKIFSKWGVQVVGDEFFFSFEGKVIYLTHGHLLCLDDEAFLKYRKKYWPLFRLLDPILPGFIENRLASLFIKKSKNDIRKRPQETFQISKKAVLERFDNGADKIICGHIHKKIISRFDNEHSLYVLPPWDERHGTYGVIDGDSFSIKEFYNEKARKTAVR